jgi:hypothetical protein
LDRRVFVVGTVMGVGTVAACGCGGGGSSSAAAPSDGVTADKVLSPVSAEPVAPSAGVPAGATPVRVDGRYRTDQAQLFLAPPPGVVKSGGGSYWETPARASIAGPKASFGYGNMGPTYSYVDVGSGWAWKNKNGDWIDTSNTPQGISPHWRIIANSATGATASFTYVVDASAGAKASWDGKRWNAYVVRGNGAARTFTSNQHASPPFQTVTYTDGSTATLKCTAAISMESSSAYAQGGAAEVSVGNGRHAVLEFERPTKPVQSATLTMLVTGHISGNGNLDGFLVDPPLNAEPPILGLAAGYSRDAGIKANADVIFSHLYDDASTQADWIVSAGVNVYSNAQWSPDVFDPAAAKDTSKLPHVHQGKWIKNIGTTTLVKSSFSGDGFSPLAPGLGALRVNIPGSKAADGDPVGYAGAGGSDLAMYLPDALCGMLDEIYIRYYLRLGSHDPEYLANMKMFRSDPNSTAHYAAHGGKFGIGPSHWTQYGGNNNIGGGNIGWTSRNAWLESPADIGSGAMQPGVHSWDMLGYNGLMGSIGGLGAAMYPGFWYCIESRLKLNTVDLSTTPFTADPAKNLNDAEIDIWIDGRKVLAMRNFSYRKLPLDYSSGPGTFNSTSKMGRTPIANGLLVPIRNLGVTAVTLNDFNGGVLPAGTDRVKFYAGLVVSKKPIGMMGGI